MQREFGVGHAGEGDVKEHMETESPKSGVRQASVSTSIKRVFFSPQITPIIINYIRLH